MVQMNLPRALSWDLDQTFTKVKIGYRKILQRTVQSVLLHLPSFFLSTLRYAFPGIWRMRARKIHRFVLLPSKTFSFPSIFPRRSSKIRFTTILIPCIVALIIGWIVLRNSNEDMYIENIPEVEVEAASSSCCWRLWGSRVVDVFFLIVMGKID